MASNAIIAIPIILPFVAAGAVFAAGQRSARMRDMLALSSSILTLALLAGLLLHVALSGEMALHLEYLCGFGLSFRADGFRAMYAFLAALLWAGATLFEQAYFQGSKTNLNRYCFFSLFTLGAVLGVLLSDDFFTTFIFFEIMSLTSYALVAHDEKPAAIKAANTYVAVAIISGMVMLMGLFLLYSRFGTLDFAALYHKASEMADRTPLYLPGVLLMVGFGAKAGMFPLHIWLPKAHPVAPAPASALLSGMLTKTGISGAVAVSCTLFLHDATWGLGLLPFAMATMLLGAVLGVFSNELKRTLACSSVSQIGFILTGVAMQGILGHHNALAVWGTQLHMVNHSLFKLVLFFIAGVVYQNLHELDLNKIRGFGRGKPLLLFLFLMGMLGIGGIPLWSGYVSKTLLHESIVEAIHLYHGMAIEPFLQMSEIIFLASGGLTVAYMLKLFIVLFVDIPPKNQHQAQKKYISWKAIVPLLPAACALPILGAVPSLMGKIAVFGQSFFHGHEPERSIHYFDWGNLKGAVISVLIGTATWFLIIRPLFMKRSESGERVYINRWPDWLDLELLVYKPLLKLIEHVGIVCMRLVSGVTDGIIRLAGNTLLSPRKRPPRTRRFWQWHVRLFFPEEEGPTAPARSAVGGVSIKLMMIGIGVGVTLLFVFFYALL